ncbi:zinc/manganese transport system substrate-binding protein [Amycolatopsis marina]|uniref:Zinc/manganese transport system substrate-binding protein n=1 Tax=Amycolatopsis marina TaxID=490629 RepID=A0A1I0Y4N7_9PSEU|nr:zinc ABC transporter substrate-binding protein [Amycolatopsis marina]SFB08365.1 zinc/manganese transport system substrate-binding protein [Amycolatopsis marina]
MIPRRRTGRLLTMTAAVTAIAFGLAACGDGGGSATENGDTIPVVASTNVWGGVVSAVGGDQVSVKSIIDDPSGDPHSYQASAEDAADVQEAQLVLYNGGGYDAFFTGLAEQAPEARKLVAFDISGKAEGDEHAGEGHAEESHTDESHADESHAKDGHADEGHADEGHADEGHEGHAHGEVNEHVWYDLETVGKVADQLATQLGELRPEAAQTFTDNAAAFKAELGQLTGRVAKIATERNDAHVLATEPVAHYLIEAAKLDDVTPAEFSRAIEEETDVPVAAQNQVNELLAGKEVQVVLNNVQTVTPVTEQVVAKAGEAGIPVVSLTETLPEGETGYIAWMSKQLDELTGALKVS